MIIYSPIISPRLQYIADFIGKELTGYPSVITDKQDEFKIYQGPRINYSAARTGADELWILPHPLLFEKGIKPQFIECFDWNGQKAFFTTEGDLPFDIFAATFYLLSRYEEYLPHAKDKYGRYAHENSLAYKEGFLHIPVVNYWLQQLRMWLQRRFTDAKFKQPQFSFVPTYDIDEAYSFKYKQWWRSAGGAIKDLMKGKLKRVVERFQVLADVCPDPYDSYNWMDELHRLHSLQPRYFFLLAAQTATYDRNILPNRKAMHSLIRQHAEKYITGIHPSWQSGDDFSLLLSEKETLEKITGIKTICSRQHFIRFTLPHTYRQLIEAGIREDFSMGYGSINGFRASVASPFYWYDLEKEQITTLRIYPFCFMEANSFFEQKLSPQKALNEMRHYCNEVKKVNSTLITIWHNTFLGTDNFYRGWREVYEQFISEVA